MLIYDMIIVGGGLSGLYAAYRYHQKHPKSKILLLESLDRLGGRIYTYEDTTYGKIEAGAARFLTQHKHVIQLIHEFGLEASIGHIPPDIGYEPVTPTNIPHTPKDIRNLSKIILKHADKTPQKVLQNQVFMDFVKKVLPPIEAQLYYDSFGYSSELTFMNAYDTVQLIKNHFMSRRFLNLKGGLNQIIDRLVAKLRTYKNIEIKIKYPVTDIQYDNQTQFFHITANQSQFQSRICICTFNKETAEHFPILRPIQPYLKYIKNLPLCRIYSQFSPNPETNEPWFKGRHKFTTNNPLRMVIPMNADRGTVMISYSDNHYATTWYKLYKTKGIDAVNKKLHKLIQESVPNTSIPPPTHTKIFYWDHAVAYYAKGFDSSTMLDKIRQPYPNIPLYLCGENYSEKNNQWMEGALDTVPSL
jgi:Flavin containing amine oxidoreductase